MSRVRDARTRVGAALALVAVLGAAVPRAAFAAPTLRLAPCAAEPTPEGGRACVACTLATDGATLASANVVVRYDLSFLRLRGDAIVERGPLPAGYTLASSVREDPASGLGIVQVAVIQPPVLTPPPLDDGALFSLCFTVPAGAGAGCAGLEILLAPDVPGGVGTDVGDLEGNAVALGTLTAGGVLVGCDTDAECVDAVACTVDACTAGVCTHDATCTTSTTTLGAATTTTTRVAPPCATVRCRLERLATELASCGDLGTLRAWIVTRVRSAAERVGRAEALARKRRRLLGAAGRDLERVTARVNGRSGRRQLADALRSEITTRVEVLRDEVAAGRP